jgi:hypothetical protein
MTNFGMTRRIPAPVRRAHTNGLPSDDSALACPAVTGSKQRGSYHENTRERTLGTERATRINALRRTARRPAAERYPVRRRVKDSRYLGRSGTLQESYLDHHAHAA